MGGAGFEWDANLLGGPADGCLDRVVQLEGNSPPLFFKKLLDKEPERQRLGEKLIEIWSTPHLPDEMKVAVYKLRDEEVDEDAAECTYDYLETTTLGQYKERYES